jgi:hypothetical protein
VSVVYTASVLVEGWVAGKWIDSVMLGGGTIKYGTVLYSAVSGQRMPFLEFQHSNQFDIKKALS